MHNLTSIRELDLKDKRVIVRADLNVPVQNGIVTNAERIKRIAPTIELLKSKGAKIILISHFARPEGRVISDMSLRFLKEELAEHFKTEVSFHNDCIGDEAVSLSHQVNSGRILLLENLRFYKEEENNDISFAEKLAALGEVYINDAFACSHRSHASIVAITQFIPSYPGLLMQEEIRNLTLVLFYQSNAITAIVAGKKVSSKFKVLKFLSTKVQTLIIGGAMANTFIKAKGHDIGASFHEPDLVSDAKAFLDTAECDVYIPVDVICAERSGEDFINIHDLKVDEISPNSIALDLGTQSIKDINAILDETDLLVWNGPVGYFEDERFATATYEIAHHIARLTVQDEIVSVAGGGDVVAAIEKAGVAEDFSYLSTGGGAFLEWMEGNELPGIKALQNGDKN